MQGLIDRIRRMPYILVQQTELLKVASRPNCKEAIPILGLQESLVRFG